jgi:hypothetical protein
MNKKMYYVDNLDTIWVDPFDRLVDTVIKNVKFIKPRYEGTCINWTKSKFEI